MQGRKGGCPPPRGLLHGLGTRPAISLALSAEQGVVLDYQEEVMVLLQDGPQLGLR
jgi:hypothetical protein